VLEDALRTRKDPQERPAVGASSLDAAVAVRHHQRLDMVAAKRMRPHPLCQANVISWIPVRATILSEGSGRPIISDIYRMSPLAYNLLYSEQLAFRLSLPLCLWNMRCSTLEPRSYNEEPYWGICRERGSSTAAKVTDGVDGTRSPLSTSSMLSRFPWPSRPS